MTSKRLPTLAPMLAALALAVFATPQATKAASFDCRAADLSAAETAICKTPALNDMDVEMATTYRLVSGLLPNREQTILEDQQKIWLSRLDEYQSSLDCIAAAYATRMAELRTAYDRIRVRP